MKTGTDEKSAGVPRAENLWWNLGLNLLAPVVVLNTLSDEGRLGPVWALVLALVFPLGYGVWDRVRRRQWNFLSMVGLVSILLTGGLGLLRLDRMWFAVKEAAVPLVLGTAVVGSLGTRRPLVRSLLLNPSVMDLDAVDAALDERRERPRFDALLARGSWMLAASFLLSAVLNFGLAVWILRSDPGTPEFNRELGRMTALSFPVISVPCMVVTLLALWYLLTGIERLTGLGMERILQPAAQKQPDSGPEAR